MGKEPEIFTFGCRLNSYESEIIEQNLIEKGLKDIAVYNSCAVTEEAIRQVKYSIRKKRRDEPNTKIVVTGCAAQIEPQSFLEMEEVDKVLGNSEKREISSHLLRNNNNLVSDIMINEDPLNSLRNGYKSKTRAFVEIQNGCNHRCTFCVIPFGRGNLRSKSKEQIIKEINNLINEGHKEIILTGVDIASWNMENKKEASLGILIEYILSEAPRLERLRLSSMDVIGFDEKLIDLIANNKRILPHIHLSLQSGDNLILKRMKRRHLREDAIDLCDQLKQKRPEISFGADLIVGFPTETEEMFQNTLDIIEECQLDWIHAFPFSPRPGTPAAKMPQNDNKLIKLRSKILRDVAKQRKIKHLENLVGKNIEVFVEKDNKGHSNQFAPIKLIEKEIKSGQTITALIKSSDENFAHGVAV
ncbi:MAG: tRNA (N(6)-L-threonylcarbamoyladenosine(37)-C(2))-methylthiotransferase MtaB [Pseudomonadota bacterium]|jgi:threonylcarbamoyladenosine tRNA methylthiotransferase MtaB|nr:tRNA (N(6)-L-threonylcarbamoyladenosine(37)-C(2))-methylthiotransferase MtaB [Hyphomicrobiales bacterium]MEC9075228.1 tRNA (N(6)-L-threonylcarbamoyladenosine(37)-C(2))-methylthiotransferase MtaB [Pseudomonadota bacterium]